MLKQTTWLGGNWGLDPTVLHNVEVSVVSKGLNTTLLKSKSELETLQLGGKPMELQEERERERHAVSYRQTMPAQMNNRNGLISMELRSEIGRDIKIRSKKEGTENPHP